MEWNQDAMGVARAAVLAVNSVVDCISMKTQQLESLLVLLAHTAGADELPTQHRENVCWLGSELADQLRCSVRTLESAT
ncbi:hypothetical protein [Paraburkholderia xenovorans]|uniref:hypothetical protein n=1 Tax=Paraburkholderia xenovorans TaxID=36873 RepID=UPI001A03EA16|nr:hypothetical protein [Paraburkholderia xenovorans]NPT39173.1 hypothetical protein [Paraburkholderia xenovorans]